MGVLIHLNEEKVETLSSNISQGLRYIGKAMQCIEEMKHGGDYGERGDYGRGGDYGERRWGNQYGRGYTRGSYGERMNGDMPPYYDPYI